MGIGQNSKQRRADVAKCDGLPDRDGMTSGLNHAVVEGLPSAADMRTYEQQARLATIADPRLRQEVSDFFSQRYIPARSKYQAERPATTAVNTMLSTYGPTGWGSMSIVIRQATMTPSGRPCRSRYGPTMRHATRNTIRPHLPAGVSLTASSGVLIAQETANLRSTCVPSTFHSYDNQGQRETIK